MKRAEVLGLISRGHKTLAVAGTHGKTTTSTLLTWLLAHAGMSPTAFLGGIGLNWGSNYVPGSGVWAVMEADEYDRSFLQLRPQMAAIMSVDPDRHLWRPGQYVGEWFFGFRQISPGRAHALFAGAFAYCFFRSYERAGAGNFWLGPGRLPG